MDLGLSGKKALVTAASMGIGRGIATVLAMEGAEVVILSRNMEHLVEAQKYIGRIAGSEVDTVVADLTVQGELEKAVSEIRERHGHIDIFVFNTGGPRPGHFGELELSDWHRAVDLLLYPAVYLTKAFIEDMRENGWGRVVYSTSVAIKEPMPGIVLSNVVRISLAGLVRSLAREYGEYGITVNAIMPGYIKTDRVIELARKRASEENRDVDDVLSNMTRDVPAKRMGDPLEVGYLVAFLASNKADYINGAIIPIDGGYLRSSL